MKQAPGDLLDFIDHFYESGEPELDKEIEIDYDGTDFDEPDILPKNKCFGQEQEDDDYGSIDNGDDDEGI